MSSAEIGGALAHRRRPVSDHPGGITMTSNCTTPNAPVTEPRQASIGSVRAPGRQRVLMLVENNSYPEDARVRREARALADAGYQVTVISPAQPTQPWRETING